MPKKSIQAAVGIFSAALLPILVAFTLNIPRVALGCFTDAVFYLAYARHFGDLVLRFGFPYYATRFGGILPDALSGMIFGEIDGIWILRWILSSTVSLSLFLFFRKRYGFLAGIIASILWSFNPAVLRLICTTYVDSTSVPFLILGCALFAGGLAGRCGEFIAGVLFALASSAHLYAAFALILLTPWLISSRRQDSRGIGHPLAWMVFGLGSTFTIGWIWYWAVWGMPALFSPTIELMRGLNSGQASLWKRPLAEALRDTPAWFGPVAMLPAILLAALNGRGLIRGAAFSLLTSVMFFWCGDIFGSAYVLSMPFYYSFLLPVTILAGATLCGRLLELQKPITRGLIFGTLGIGIVTPPLLLHFGLQPMSVGFYVVALLLVLVPVWGRLSNRSLVILSILGIAALSLLVGSTGIFSQFFGSYPSKDIPVLELALALQKEIPSARRDGEVIRFWYDDDHDKQGGSDRRMIGSYWLHTFGKLTGENEKFVPFPNMSSEDAEAINNSGVDRIVLFDQDTGKVTDALQKIRQAGLSFRELSRGILHSPSDSSRILDVAVLERNQPELEGTKTAIDLHGLELRSHGKINWMVPNVLLNSGPEKWACFAQLPLGDLKKGDRIHVQCRIRKGYVRFVLTGGGADVWHVERWPIDGEQEVLLTAPKDLKDASLDFRNMYPNGSRSSLLIEGVLRN